MPDGVTLLRGLASDVDAVPPCLTPCRCTLQENRVRRPRKGRAPRCVVLAPTRELANQVRVDTSTSGMLPLVLTWYCVNGVPAGW